MAWQYLLLAALLTPTAALLKDTESAADSSHLAVEGADPVLNSQSTCGLDGGQPDCERADVGSCGTACCLLDVSVPGVTPEDAYEGLKKFLQSGGRSGSYKYVDEWHDQRRLVVAREDTHGDKIHGWDDGGHWMYMLLGKHTTSLRRYNDTLSFSIRRMDNVNGAIVRMFSKSDISGALGDAGQNYKTLKYLLRALGPEIEGGIHEETLFGCPDPKPRVLVKQSPRLNKNSSCLLSVPWEERIRDDCGLIDVSGCGSACCVLDAEFEDEPAVVYEYAKQFLESGGDSHGGNGYYYNSGVMPFNEHLPDDLRPLNMSYKFIFQGWHRSSGEAPGWWQFNDTLNFNLQPRAGGRGTIMRAFSISDMGGDIYDFGQNYKNLAYMLNRIGDKRKARRIIRGCSDPPNNSSLLYSSANALLPGGNLLLSLAIAALAVF